jgi:hypothetical protein
MLVWQAWQVGMGASNYEPPAPITTPYLKKRHGANAPRYYIPYCLAVILCW